ncbi:MAG TPA: hypothetical protein VLK85_10925 [Ramlibacter sp.]|nr:hypothetical protein [Ramlibacter sp.]
MRNLISAKPLLAAALAVGTLAAASAAHARTDVSISIGVPLAGYVQPAAVYVQPAPVYVRPQPVYVQSQPVYYYDGGHRGHRHHRGWGDRDHDGVPNRYDRAPGNPYRY